MRDGSYTVAQLMWARGHQTIWTMPNVYALGSDGKVSDGCRALDALRVIHDLDDLFQNRRGARDRIQRGIVPSEEVTKRAGKPHPQPHSTARLEAQEDIIRFVPQNGVMCRSKVQRHTPSCSNACLTNYFHRSENTFAPMQCGALKSPQEVCHETRRRTRQPILLSRGAVNAAGDIPQKRKSSAVIRARDHQQKHPEFEEMTLFGTFVWDWQPHLSSLDALRHT
jgi:hypothetical protein